MGGDFGKPAEVVVPGVRAEVAAKVILVDSAVPCVRTTPGDKLNLGATCPVEVGRLIGR